MMIFIYALLIWHGTAAVEPNPSRSLKTSTKLKYYHYSVEGIKDTLALSKETKLFQRERENRSSTVRIPGFHKKVLFAHHSPSKDIHISREVAKGKLFEQNEVVAVAEHIEKIVEEYDLLFVKDSAYNLGFIDFGANIGMYSVGVGAIALGRLPVTIFSFEPMSMNIALLTSSLRQNKLSNVYMFPYGLTDSGDLGDTLTFAIDPNNKGGSRVTDDASKGELVQIETVHLDLFTTILKEQYPAMYQSWSHAVWVKMDVEGFEPALIRGARNSLFSNSEMDPCFITLEFWQNPKEIATALMEAGYARVSFDWKSIAQNKRYTRKQALEEYGWNAAFAKVDAEECVLRKVNSIKKLRAQLQQQETAGEEKSGMHVAYDPVGPSESKWCFTNSQITGICFVMVVLVGLAIYCGWNNRYWRYRLCPNHWHPHRQ